MEIDFFLRLRRVAHRLALHNIDIPNDGIDITEEKFDIKSK